MSGWTDALNVVEKLAPTIGTVLGGPLVGGGLAALEAVFGLTPKPDASTDDRQNDIAAAISGATPEQLLALKAADQKHQEFMAQLGFSHIESLQEIAANDRNSARNREIQVKDRTPAHLAYIIIGGFFGVATAQLVALMGWPDEAAKIPPQGWVIIGNISGYLAAEAKAAASYYFGSSSGSDEKTRLLAKAQPVEDQ